MNSFNPGVNARTYKENGMQFRHTRLLLLACAFILTASQPLRAQHIKDTAVSMFQIPMLTIKAHQKPFLLKILSFKSYETIENTNDSTQWQELLVSASGCCISNGPEYRFKAIKSIDIDNDGDVTVTYFGIDMQNKPVELMFFASSTMPFSTFSVGHDPDNFTMYNIKSKIIRLLPLDDQAVKAMKPMAEGPDAAYLDALRTAFPLQ